jgi:predicted adenylyl cyclase CyaB
MPGPHALAQTLGKNRRQGQQKAVLRQQRSAVSRAAQRAEKSEMARNVEIKARVPDMPALRQRVQALADSGPEFIAQDDTFFACPNGRLKLRVFADGSGELIAYERADTTAPKTSDYLITPVTDPDHLRETLARALGIAGRVVKQRTLYLVGATRIHLDHVEGLGDHLELEVVLRDDQPADDGHALAHELLDRLGVTPQQWIAQAYVDLLRLKDSR